MGDEQSSGFDFKILDDGRVQILQEGAQIAVLGFDPQKGMTDKGKIRVAKQYLHEYLGERE